MAALNETLKLELERLRMATGEAVGQGSGFELDSEDFGPSGFFRPIGRARMGPQFVGGRMGRMQVKAEGSTVSAGEGGSPL